MNDFAIIPAIDLKDGAVVHASGGMRAAYRPIETPLGPAKIPAKDPCHSAHLVIPAKAGIQ